MKIPGKVIARMFWVYVIRSLKDGRFYIGATNNLEIRLQQHDEGITRTTRKRGPFQVVYSESFETLSKARKREQQIKSYKGGNAFKSLIKKIGPVV